MYPVQLIHFWSLCLFCAMSISVMAQKTMHKSWDAKTVHSIQLESDNVSMVSVITEPSERIVLATTVAGENNEHILVQTKFVDGTLQITTGFNPYFKKYDDKLAAHKVIAIEMKLIIPAGKSVFISSAIASVRGKGSFKNFDVALTEGICALSNFTGDANLSTTQGAISVLTTQGVHGVGVSTYGNVQNQLSTKKEGTGMISAKSMYGDILLKQTQ